MHPTTLPYNYFKITWICAYALLTFEVKWFGSNFLKEHINREHAQYGLTKTEKLGTWAFGDDLTDNDFHPTEVQTRSRS